jgi:hypothetical protein
VSPELHLSQPIYFIQNIIRFIDANVLWYGGGHNYRKGYGGTEADTTTAEDTEQMVRVRSHLITRSH